MFEANTFGRECKASHFSQLSKEENQIFKVVRLPQTIIISCMSFWNVSNQ